MNLNIRCLKCLVLNVHKTFQSKINCLPCKKTWSLFIFRSYKRQAKKVKKQESVWSGIFNYSAFVVGIGILATDRLVSFTSVTGRSMQPTINPNGFSFNDWILLDKRPVRNHSLIRRGDIVTYKTLHNPDEINIKRVIALEGDKVKTLGYKKRVVKVPTGHCWVEGDNHACSDDSNRRGPVPLGLITGRALFVMFPVSRWQMLQRKFPHNRIRINPNCDVHLEMLPNIETPTGIYDRRK